MRKILLLLALILISTPGARAATSPEWAAFLKKLNLYYYSPARQGFVNFQCDTHFAFLDKSFANMRDIYQSKAALMDQLVFKYTMRGERGELQAKYPARSGDPLFDKGVENIVAYGIGFFEKFDRSFSNIGTLAKFDEKEVAEKNYQVVNLAQGFNVIKTEDKKTWTFSFNQQAMLTGMVFVDDGKVRRTIKTVYLPTPQGMILSEMVDEEVSKEIIRGLKVTYQELEGYKLPASVTYHEHIYHQKPGTDDYETKVTFDNYQINVELPARAEIRF